MNGIASARYIVGDAVAVMADMPDGSVDLIMTSPPFLALRSYLPADHPDKDLEIGSESTPAEFIDVLLRLTAEWRRLLAPHGSIVVELGDTYSVSGGAGGDYNDNGLRGGQEKFVGSGRMRSGAKDAPQDGDGGYAPDQRVRKEGYRAGIRNMNNKIQPGGDGWPLAKCLTMVPEAYRMALAYGTNPHTGVPSPAGRWRIRNVIRWVRPNPPVGALGDKYRPATSDLVVACVSKDRWFDLDAVRGTASPNTHRRVAAGAEGRTDLPSQQRDGNWNTLEANNDQNPAGAPPLDWWKISPTGYSGSHYAVYPGELCVIPIKSMCPPKVCRTCGKASRRIIDADYVKLQATNNPTSRGMTDGVKSPGSDPSYKHGRARKVVETVGWSDCGHGDWRRGVVLDPFAGSGTTLMVATGLDRDAIGIDLDQRNLTLAEQRIGMFLTQEAT